MPTLTVTKNYVASAILTKTMLDQAFQSCETFFNSTKIDSTNIQAGGIATANYAGLSVDAAAIASDAVTTSKILDSNVTTAKLADASITTAKLASALNLPGVAKVRSRNIMVSNSNTATNGLSMIRGSVLANGTAGVGEGFLSSRSSAGVYTISFNASFADIPSCSFTSISDTGLFEISSASLTSVTVNFTSVNAGALADVAFFFIVIGQAGS